MAKNLLIDGQMYLYGPVGMSWFDEGFTPEDVVRALAEHGKGDITVRINSGGGYAWDGSAIYSLLKAHAGKVTTRVDGVAASAASLIFMAGDTRIMSRAANLMIHDAATVTFGNAAEHERSAEMLDKLSETYADVYAEETGLPRDEARALMQAETWFTPEEALEKKFATAADTGKSGDAAIPAAAFPYQIYAKAPSHLPRCVIPKSKPAASAANHEVVMTKPTPAEDPKPAALDPKPAAPVAPSPAPTPASADAQGKAWAANFYASAGETGVPLSDLNAIVAESSTHEIAKDKLIEKMTASANSGKPSPVGSRAKVGMEDHEKLVTGATKAIIGKLSMFNDKDGNMSADGERNEFSGLRLDALARLALERRGVRWTSPDTMAMVGEAFLPVMAGGLHSTSDFANILANVANKSLLKGYQESEETYSLWTGKGSLSDFKIVSRVDTGLFPSLTEVPEGAEYNYATISDRKEQVALATYGKLFGITRQAVINDDLNAFSKVPQKMGRAAKRTIGNLVYAVLTSNPAMSDSVALFHTATHKNLATGGGSALGTSSLDAGRTAMGRQQDVDAKATALNIRPKWLIVPLTLEGSANVYMKSQTEVGQANPNVANKVAGMANVIADGRLDTASTTAWYLAADAGQHDTIEVDYLNGIEVPTLERKAGWSIDQLEWKVRIDAAVKAWEWRTLYKGAGA